ncbi:glycoside hydrolase family 127 protein [Actinopolymorpha alba]|uniref:glycoside hydrolase family 127 protein n=1 Tax=Actinopolymorpha alba TaxID=533267 RepID=UPI0012F6F1FB|nr:beta-L-arabinofuranosidase domain-containing protein [Actinopolymorpha alba]
MAALTPLPLAAIELTGGFLGRLQQANSAMSIPRGADHLERQKAWVNFDNVAAGVADAEYHGPCFEDGEAYKWLEAVAWDAGRTNDPQLLEWLSSYSRRIAAAQDDDGYLNTFVQSGQRAGRYERLAWDHEIFNAGALIQSAVAQFRATGLTGLLETATRTADHLDRTFGPGKQEGTCGHPLIEMALVELYRTTGDSRYLDLARYFVDVRGHDLLDPTHAYGDAYHSDRVPVRDTIVPEGHAVRAVYLAAGATDVAIETGDLQLLDQLRSQWQNMVDQKMYVTGGLGSRWEGEAFGDPYELPSDRAYAETCAAIAGMQWSWRLLLATGEGKYADLIERQLYNAVLPGVSLDGDSYFYANALQVRAGAVATDTRMAAGGRQHWFGCSCCPTNLMRTLGSLHTYLASSSEDGLQIHQFASATIQADLPVGQAVVTMETAYPWSGRVTLTIQDSPRASWGLRLRVPAWATGATLQVGESTLAAEPGTYVHVEKSWTPGETVVLDLPLTPRFTAGHHRSDSTRGCVAIERGPLVYAVEQVDQADAVVVDDLLIDPTILEEEYDEELFGGVPVVIARTIPRQPDPTAGDQVPLPPVRAIPYFMWANREVGPMRVWLPASNPFG